MEFDSSPATDARISRDWRLPTVRSSQIFGAMGMYTKSSNVALGNQLTISAPQDLDIRVAELVIRKLTRKRRRLMVNSICIASATRRIGQTSGTTQSAHPPISLQRRRSDVGYPDPPISPKGSGPG